jgi:SHS2 domain-containing protein
MAAATSRSDYRQIEHTADLALELWAPTQEELLRVAARAIVDVLTGASEPGSAGMPADLPATPATSASRRIAIDAVDPEDRLVQWLNEVIVAAVTDGFLIADADIELDESRLSAEARGQGSAGHRIVTELKSATYHDLALERTDLGWRARVVIDV